MQACRAVTDALGEFASGGSRLWVSGSGGAFTISVSALDWWGSRADLEEAVLDALALPEDQELSALLLRFSNAVADDLSEEYDDPDTNAFPTAVYGAVAELDGLSRELERTCTSIGVEVDSFHPLDATGSGGASDT